MLMRTQADETAQKFTAPPAIISWLANLAAGRLSLERPSRLSFTTAKKQWSDWWVSTLR